VFGSTCVTFIHIHEGEKVLRSQCLFGYSLASFKLGALDEALESFEAALVTAGDDLYMRGHVTVLLAQTLWAIGTEEGREAAKTQFLDWYVCSHKDCSFSFVVGKASADHSPGSVGV
jgi:hypothetical protein